MQPAVTANMQEAHQLNNPDSTAPSFQQPSFPGQLTIIAICNLIVGPLLTLVNLIVVGRSISVLRAAGEPEALTVGLEINIALFAVFGFLLVLGGIGLLLKRKWARICSLIAGGFSFLLLFATVVITNVLKSLYEAGSFGRGTTGAYHQIQIVTGVPALAPLYGILLIVMLMLPKARAWASGKVLAAPGDPSQYAAATTVIARPTSGLAVASLICSVLPFMLLTQIAGLTMVIIALSRIRKSKGTLGGKGFAIAGVTISSLIFLFIGGIVMLIWLTGGFK